MDDRRRTVLFVNAAVTLLLTAVLAAGPARAQSVEYAALGDSYASGLGTREYLDDDSGCKRSPHAHPSLLAADLGADFAFAACAGARTADVIENQLGSLSASTDLVTLTVGGNDTGWASVIQQCAYPYPLTCDEQIDQAREFIQNTLPGRLEEVYDAVADAAPTARIVVLGYPRLFNGRECNAITRIDPDEQARLNDAADLLAETIGATAAGRGLDFVDVRDPFDGHAVCDDTEWINGLAWPIGESYHPNRDGQRNGYLAGLTALM
ncbi:SGNH/GDSL hydrolase family protein [Glycomyces xiaoerkulensis]|uniref:SGNH/GDSL hydrolase family protein n=1 Tax=Glycomyces xiaoerkulensis TaxID=2038139 RepID=UPI000C25D9AA|nr:SGNH/GDSL hydrolase family protein [Glycomyces xiaoerkulensis]